MQPHCLLANMGGFSDCEAECRVLWDYFERIDTLRHLRKTGAVRSVDLETLAVQVEDIPIEEWAGRVKALRAQRPQP